MASMFNRGFQAVNEEKQRQEEQRNRGRGLFRFYLKKDKEEADVTFLTEQPVNFHEHTIKKFVNGKEIFENIPCIGEGCKHCADGDRPSFKSAWLIIDHREYEYEKDGKKQTGCDQLRLLVYGTKTASQLDRKSERYGLMGRVYTIVRLGTGTSTTYTFEHGDKYTITREEIESIMPDDIKEIYDGTTESLYTVIEKQIEMLVTDDLPTSDEDKEPVNEDLVSLEDKEEDKPTQRIGVRRRGIRGKVENSSKPTTSPSGKQSIKSILKSRRK